MRIRTISLLPMLVLLFLSAGLAMAQHRSGDKATAQGMIWISEAQQSVQEVRHELGRLGVEFERKEAMHQRLVERIEDFKGTPIQTLRLESLQRHAQALARERARLMQRIEDAEARLRKTLGDLAEEIERRLRHLESGEPKEPAARMSWVAQQQELLSFLRRIQSSEFLPALPSIPLAELRPSDGPEELREMADELADISEKYMAHVAAIEQRITELRKRRRLVKLAEDLVREEGLFDESMRYRKLARVRPSRSSDEDGNQGSSYAGGATGRSEGDAAGGKTAEEQPAGGDESPGVGEQREIAGGRGEGEGEAGPPAEEPGAGALPGNREAGDRGEAPGDDPSAEPAAEHGYEGEESEGMNDDQDLDGWQMSSSVDEPASVVEEAMPGAPEAAAPAAMDDAMQAARFRGAGHEPQTHLSLQEELEPGLGITDPQVLEGMNLQTQLRVLERSRRVARRQARQLQQSIRRLRQRASEIQEQEGW